MTTDIAAASPGLLKAGPMSDRTFRRLSEFIHSQYGIKMPPSKRVMLESRLMKRLRALDMGSYERYCEYLFSPEGMSLEIVPMIDVVTTNKTDFFREPDHFVFLAERVLPELVPQEVPSSRRKLAIWSAGCSTGEEPYTLAMVLSEHREKSGNVDFSILATDISSRVLEKAALGIYEMERAAPVPLELRNKYMLKSRDKSRGLVRMAPELRCKVGFQRLNLLDEDFRLSEPVDIIFCRNVIIYFDRPTQERLLNRLCKYLKTSGYIFIGHSETLTGLDLPLKSVGPTIYRRQV